MFTFTAFSLFFGGLTAAALPVVLHFLMQGKPKVIEFPALMFISEQIETHRRNFQLKHLILLLLRIAAFVILGFALSRPVLKLGWLGGFLPPALGGVDAPVAAVIIIDNSVRMEYTAKNKTRLDAAKEFALRIVRRLPRDSQVAVLSCDASGGNQVFQVDALAAEEKISRLQTSPLTRPFTDVIKNAALLLNDTTLDSKELYLLSDLTGCSAASPIPVPGNVFVIDCGVADPVNAAINKVTIQPENLSANTPIHFDVSVSSTNQSPKTVDLIIGNQVRMSKTIDFTEPNRSVVLSVSGFAPGAYQGQLRFSAGDALAIDDQYYFSLNITPPKRILIFAQPPVKENTLFFQQALTAAAFETETLPMTDLQGLTLDELKKYDAVVLLDPLPMQGNVWGKLSDYVQAGFGAGVFLGANCNDMKLFNSQQATEILGAKIVRQARRPDGDIWLIAEQSPVFAPAAQGQPLADLPWITQRVFRYWQVSELSPRSGIAAKFSDTRPAILTQSIGRGQTATVLTSLSNDWTLWTKGEASWMFLLLSEGLADYLTGTAGHKYNFLAGEPVNIAVPAGVSSVGLAMPAVDGKKSKELTVVNEQVSLRDLMPGNYNLRSGGKQAVDIAVSVNLQPDQTDLRRVKPEYLDSIFGKDNYTLVTTPQDIERGVVRKRIGSEIYTFLLLLLAGIFAAEYCMANRFYGR